MYKDLLWFYTNFRIDFSSSMKNAISILIEIELDFEIILIKFIDYQSINIGCHLILCVCLFNSFLIVL